MILGQGIFELDLLSDKPVFDVVEVDAVDVPEQTVLDAAKQLEDGAVVFPD